MRRHLLTLVIGALAFGLWSGDAQAQSAQGKNSAFAVTYVWNLEPPGPGTLALSVTIPRAKGKRMLMIDAVAISNEFGPISLSAGVLVNGNPLIPKWPGGSAVANCDLATEFACTATGHWWVDLDAAEAQNPGTVKNQPLTVDLFVSEENGTGAAEVSLRAWMMKK
jgi:hypothetical protein